MSKPMSAEQWQAHKRQRFIDDASEVTRCCKQALEILNALPMPTELDDNLLFSLTRASIHARALIGAVRSIHGHKKP